MKIAIISDIHGNWPALMRVAEDIAQWQPDQVVVNGDIINRGPCSAQCWRFVWQRQQQDGWHLLRGNHEDYVLSCADADPDMDDPAAQMQAFAHWTYQQMGTAVADVAQLGDQFSWVPANGRELRAVHAAMGNNRLGVYPDTSDDDIRQQIAPAPALFVTSHTHRPLQRPLDDSLVVNIGSVGAPFDGDKRLSYGRFVWRPQTDWQSEIVRLDYDWQQTEKDYASSGFLEAGGPMAQLMLIEHRYSRGLIHRWSTRYYEPVLARQISLADSVRQLLQDEDLRPLAGPPGWLL